MLKKATTPVMKRAYISVAGKPTDPVLERVTSPLPERPTPPVVKGLHILC
jgi:hypothetical protein